MIDPVPPDSDWFPVRVTAVLGGGAMTFQEVWATAGGTIADKIGGRVNSSNDPAYAIDGSTFAVTAAGSAVQVLARRAVGAGGVQWELKGFGASTPSLSGSHTSGSGFTISTNRTLVIPVGTFLAFATGTAIFSGAGAIQFGLAATDGITIGDITGISIGSNDAVLGSNSATSLVTFGPVTNLGSTPNVNLVYKLFGAALSDLVVYSLYAMPITLS